MPALLGALFVVLVAAWLIISNPLLLDDEASGQEKSAGTPGTRPQVAKMQRQAKEQREKNKALTVEVLTLRKQVQDLGGEATKIASVVSEKDIEGVASDSASTTSRFDARRPSQVMQLSELAQEGVLSESAVAAAKEMFELHVTDQLDKQRYASAASSKQQQQQQAMDLARITQGQESIAREHERTASAQLRALERSRPASFAARSDMNEWLQKTRLSRHELLIVDFAGPETALSDLASLDESDVAALCAQMTSVEARRFRAELGQLRSETKLGAPQPEPEPEPEPEAE